MSLKNIGIKTNSQTALVIIGAVFCVVAVIFSVKWCLGHTISVRAQQKEVADVSVDFAPDDPQTHYSSAVLHEASFLPEDLAISTAEYEKAAALSPNNYLLWLSVGKARERNGDTEGAEKAYRKAVELAPNYVDTHWSLGNNLLRQGKAEDAYNEIRQSAIGSDKYVIPAIDTAWRIFNGDISLIKKNIGDSPKLNAFLAAYLVSKERYNDSFDIWNSLSQETKSVIYRDQSEEIYAKFRDAGKYGYASIVKTSLDGQDASQAFGKIINGGFENNVKQQKLGFFDWQISEGPQPLIGYDDKIKHGGNFSMVLIFNSPDGQDFRPLSQAIAVQPGKSYQFEGFYKAELKTGGTLRWEILNVTDKTVIAATDAVSTNADWTKFGLTFKVPENVEAVVLNLARIKCASTICPITGKVWFDDFLLQDN